MTRTTPEIRIQIFDKVLTYLKANLFVGETETFVDRSKVAEELEVDKWLVDRALQLLTQNGALQVGLRSHYRLLDGLAAWQGEDLESVFREYNRESTKRNPPKKQEVTTSTPAEPPAQPELFDALPVKRKEEFGYVIASGVAYFDSIEQAAEEGQRQALLHGLSEVSIVQRLAVVEVQKPIIRML
jgi:hypothetical protein